MEKKKSTKVTINELRSIVRKILKEEFGGDNATFIGDLLKSGKATFFPEVNKQGYRSYDMSKGQNRIISGGGKLVFNEPVSNVKYNMKSSLIEKNIGKFYYIEGIFSNYGLSSGYLFSPDPATNKEPVGFGNVKKPEKAEDRPNFIKTIIPPIG